MNCRTIGLVIAARQNARLDPLGRQNVAGVNPQLCGKKRTAPALMRVIDDKTVICGSRSFNMFSIDSNMTENYRESFADVPVGGIGMVYDGDSLFRSHRRWMCLFSIRNRRIRS